MKTLPKIPNNPAKAYWIGKRHGAQETMDIVAKALLDKCGFHPLSEDPTDHMSIEYVYHQAEETADAINKGYVTRMDIKRMLEEEARIRFVDDGVK